MLEDKRYYSEKKISFSKSVKTFQNAMGIAMMIMGGLMLFGCVSDSSNFQVADWLLSFAIAIGGGALFVFGKKRKKLIENFLQYVQYLEVQETIEISELSTRMGKDEEKILKELGELVKKQYFVNMIIDYSTNQIKTLTTSKERKEEFLKQENKEIIAEEDVEVPKVVQEDAEVLKVVQEGVGSTRTLKICKEWFEHVYKRNGQEIAEVYHYFNVMNVSVDTFMKMDRLVVKLVNGKELSFYFKIDNQPGVCEELATLLCKLKENASTMEELGVTEEDRLKELQVSQEKSKSESSRKIGKVIRVAIPVLCLILLLNIFNFGKVSDEIVIECAQTEVSELLKSSSTARWGKAKILDKDDYDRYLVYVPLEATNGFGAYSKLEFMVIVRGVTSDGEYYKSSFSTQNVTGFASSVNNYHSDDWSYIKELNNWGEEP